VLLLVIEIHSQDVTKTRLGQVPAKYRARVRASLETLSEMIQDHRKKMGYTQEQLAESLGIATMTIQFIEQGRRFPSLPMLIYICDRIGFDIRFECSRFDSDRDEDIIGKPLLAAEGDLFDRPKKPRRTQKS
jgi:transcriptional regulator with XRE-family HTH domain